MEGASRLRQPALVQRVGSSTCYRDPTVPDERTVTDAQGTVTMLALTVRAPQPGSAELVKVPGPDVSDGEIVCETIEPSHTRIAAGHIESGRQPQP